MSNFLSSCQSWSFQPYCHHISLPVSSSATLNNLLLSFASFCPSLHLYFYQVALCLVVWFEVYFYGFIHWPPFVSYCLFIYCHPVLTDLMVFLCVLFVENFHAFSNDLTWAQVGKVSCIVGCAGRNEVWLRDCFTGCFFQTDLHFFLPFLHCYQLLHCTFFADLQISVRIWS